MSYPTSVDFLLAFRMVQAETYAVAKAHGFQDNENNLLNVPTKLALIATEVAEAIEAHRKNEMTKFPSELADIVIRTMDLAESLRLDLGAEILQKHEFNKDRPAKHGNKLY